jgi:Mg2+ and Co2+ transporter CorA
LRTLEEFEDFERHPGWWPGAEPGIDPKKPDGGQATVPDLHAECQITVVDFSEKDLTVHELKNAELVEFVRQPQPSWAKCRWINVNGLSWDVIQALGKYKDLHRLAIEDIMVTKNRTKADW